MAVLCLSPVLRHFVFSEKLQQPLNDAENSAMIKCSVTTPMNGADSDSLHNASIAVDACGEIWKRHKREIIPDLISQ